MKKILIVDDDPAIRDVIAESLEGYEIIFASDGSEGVARVKKEKPDLVLMDMSMPKLSGLNALKRIRGDSEIMKTPVILITGYGSVADIEEGFSAQANDYIVKPFSPGKLRAKVDILLAQAGSGPVTRMP